MQARISILKDVFGLLREVIIVVALGMFLVLPGWVNTILNAAGFTRGSIGGFEWESEIVASAETNHQAQERILELEGQLAKVQTSLQDISRQATEAPLRAQANALSKEVGDARKDAVTTRGNLAARMADQKSFAQRVNPALVRANPEAFKSVQQ